MKRTTLRMPAPMTTEINTPLVKSTMIANHTLEWMDDQATYIFTFAVEAQTLAVKRVLINYFAFTR